jgi:curved DNA-binding protein CbpA
MYDYYFILGVPENASPGEIKRAYKKRTKFYHPDQYQTDPERKAVADEFMPLLNEAYEILRDPIKRQTYDQQRRYGDTSTSDASVWELLQQLDEARQLSEQLSLRMAMFRNEAATSKERADRLERALSKTQLRIQSLENELEIQKAMVRAQEMQRSAQTGWTSPRGWNRSQVLKILFGVILFLSILIPVIRALGSSSLSWTNSASADQSSPQPPGAVVQDVAKIPTASPTSIATPTPTVSPTFTTTPTVSLTPTTLPSSTPTPTPPPTSTPRPQPMGTVKSPVLNVREGPGLQYPVQTQMQAGDQFSILGKDAYSPGWWKIRTSGGSIGWISAASRYASVTHTDSVEKVNTPPPPKKQSSQTHSRSPRKTCPSEGVQITRIQNASGPWWHIFGTADIPNLWYWKMEASLDGDDWLMLYESRSPASGLLVRLNLTTLPALPKYIRLTAVDRSGNYPEPCVVQTR